MVAVVDVVVSVAVVVASVDAVVVGVVVVDVEVACVGSGGLGHVGALVVEHGIEATVKSHIPVTQFFNEFIFIPDASH